MDINELQSYRLSDAIKFHDRLNARIWGEDERLLPKVRENLLKIAQDFQEFLGVGDLEIRDITLSGSNAAYTYTDHSDIDLHLVVDMPRQNDEVYRELFNAKKYQYNDEHNYRVGPYDVELYVQDAAAPHVSQGIYSVMQDQWLQVPRRRRPEVDDVSVRSKYEDLGARIEQATDSGDLERMDQLWNKIKDMRKSGLAQTGEFGPENLAFKLLRANGLIERLNQARLTAQDERLSLEERKKKKRRKPRTRYAYGGWWYPGFGYAGSGEGEAGGDGGGGESIRESASSEAWTQLAMPEFDFPVYVKFEGDRVIIGASNMEIEGEAPGRFWLSFHADLGTGRILDMDGDWNRNAPFDINMVDQSVLQDIVEEVLTAVGRRWGGTARAIRAELEGGIGIDVDETVQEDRVDDVRVSDATDEMLRDLENVKMYQRSQDTRDRAIELLFVIRQRFLDTFQGRERAQWLDDFLTPLDWCAVTLATGTWNRQVMDQTLDICITLLDEKNDQLMRGIVARPDEGGIEIDLDETVREDRVDDVEMSDAIDSMIDRLETAKIYVMSPSSMIGQAQVAISDVIVMFVDVFERKISQQKYEDVLVPLNWCLDALANQPVDGAVIIQTLDISINLLDEMNDQIRRDMDRAKDDDPGGIEVDLSESTTTLSTEQIKKFVAAAARMLKMKTVPKMRLYRSKTWAAKNNSFGRYDHDNKVIELSLHGRHAADILRTLAHELTHARQDQVSELPPDAGRTGSPWEDEANALAGRIMRHWTDLHPEVFERNLTEGIMDLIPVPTRQAIAGMCAVAGLAGCVTMDQLRTVQTLGRAVNSMDRYGTAGAQEEITQELKNYLRARGGDEGAKNQSRIYRWEREQQPSPPPRDSRALPPRVLSREPQQEDYSPDNPPGPESKPTMPAGTVRVDVSDVYDWYKLGQHISNLQGLGHHDFGQGPPSTIMAFGSEDEEHKYIKDLEKTGLKTTDIDPRDPHPPRGMRPQKTDPAYNVNEASGYIPVNDREARDPRYSMAITQDIRPGEIQKQARKMGFKTDAAGRPPLLMKRLTNLLESMKEQPLDERCWTGYRQAGMKKKGHRQVPNCVPVEENRSPELAASRVKALISKLHAGEEAVRRENWTRLSNLLMEINTLVYELFVGVLPKDRVRLLSDQIGELIEQIEGIRFGQQPHDGDDVLECLVDIGAAVEIMLDKIAKMRDDPGGIEVDLTENQSLVKEINRIHALLDNANAMQQRHDRNQAVEFLQHADAAQQQLFADALPDESYSLAVALQNLEEELLYAPPEYDTVHYDDVINDLGSYVERMSQRMRKLDDPGGIEIDLDEATGDPAFDRMMSKITAATQDLSELPDEHLKDTEYNGIAVTSAVYPNTDERRDTIRWRGTVGGQRWEANGTPSALYMLQGPKKKHIAAILHHLNANNFPWDVADVKIVPVQRWQQVRETAVGVPPVGPALPMPRRLPRRAPPWPGPGERRRISEIAGDRVYLQFADIAGPAGSSLRWYAAPDRATRFRDATLTGTVTEPADILKALQNLTAKQGFDSVAVVMDPKLIARYPRDLHIFKQMADEGWFEDVPGLAGRVRVTVTGEYPSMTAIRGGWQRTRPVTEPPPARAQQMPDAQSDVPVGRDGLVRFKLPRAWFDAIVQSDNPQFTQYLRKATREEGGKYFQMTPDDFRNFKRFVTGWDFVSQAQAIIDQAYARVPASQRPSALVRFYFKGQPGSDAI